MIRTEDQEIWRLLIDHMSADEKSAWLAKVLKTRRKLILFALNGRSQSVKRGIVRDYLRENIRMAKP